MVRDYTGILEQFGNYTSYYTTAGQKPTKEDIETFMDRFMKKSAFQMGSAAWDSTAPVYRGAKYKHPVSRQVIFSMADGLTTEAYKDEVRPILYEAFQKAHGEFGIVKEQFSLKPISTDGKDLDHELVKDFIRKYNRKTLPFRLRKIMHHPMIGVVYFGSKGSVEMAGRRIVLRSEKEVEDFIDTTTKYQGHIGGSNAALRDIWFVPFPTGEYPKFGIIDIDNPGEMDFEEYRKVSYDIARNVAKKHDVLVQFTGKSFQVWFDVRPATIETVGDLRNYIYDLVTKITKEVSFSREEALGARIPFIDTSRNGKNQTAPSFFGMYYKPNRDVMENSNLVRVPVEIKDMKKFDPMKHAHPIHVLDNFDTLKAKVDRWFLSVGIGDGFSDLEAAPPCYRTPNSKPDKTHRLTKLAKEWKYPSPPTVRFSEIGQEVLQHPEIVVTPKYDGWLSVISYKRRGGFKVNGVGLDKPRKGGRTAMDIQRSLMLFKKEGGLAWDNYITREFERLCERAGIDEITCVAELITVDSFGVVEGASAVTKVVAKDLDGRHDEQNMRRLKAVITDVLTYEDQDMQDKPFSERIAKAMDLDGDRIRCVDPVVITDDFENQVRAIWSYEVLKRGNEGLFIHAGSKRYRVKRHFTIDAVVMGVFTDTKRWMDKKEQLGSLLVGVSKETNRGRAIVPIGAVGGGWTDEESKALYRQVLGERTGEFGEYANIIPSPGLAERYSNIVFVEPEVIIEIEFQRLSPIRSISGPTIISRQQRRKTVQRKKTINVTPKEYFSRSLIGPPKFMRVREDKSVLEIDDITHKQGEMAGGFEIGVRGNPGLKSQERTNSIFVTDSGLTRVLPNPYYGWNAGPRPVAGGPQPWTDEITGNTFDTTPIGSTPYLPAGKGRFDKYLTLRNEFANQLTLTDDKWGLHYDPERIKFPKDKAGVSYFLDVPGFKVGSEDGVYDEEGPAVGGVAHDKNREETLYYNQLIADYREDTEQAKRDTDLATRINFTNNQPFKKPIDEITTDDFDSSFYEDQAERLSSKMRRSSFDSATDRGIQQKALALKARRNPNGAEETIEESVVPATRPATFLSPFDIFMEFGGEEDEFESEHSS